jgi:hypothetical protein
VFEGEEELAVTCYTDASFQIDADDSKSQSIFMFCLNGGAVNRKNSKQDTVADSTTEPEYIAASKAERKLLRSEILFLNWVLFLVRLVIWIYIVAIVEP